jgi:long-chain-fatty-acyl-CoA reductase
MNITTEEDVAPSGVALNERDTGASSELRLPTVVAGEVCMPDRDVLRLSYDDVDVIVPAPSLEDGERVIASRRQDLSRMSIDDITAFFAKVGEAWSDPANHWRKIASTWVPRVTGYSPQFVEGDLTFLGNALKRAKQYDFLETDLGDPSLLDEWNRTQAVWQRCVPQGLITHIMVGNVPMASLFTLYRSLATKNVTVAKVPSRDVVSALCFALCIQDTDVDHPVAKALSALYWEAGSAFEDTLLAASDAVSVWGRAPAIEAVKQRVRSGVDVIEFGPKRSFGLILSDDGDWERTGLRAACDVMAYDQEACFSLQEIYVPSAHLDAALPALQHGLESFEQRSPRRGLGADGDAHIQRARLEAEAEGWNVLAADGTQWTIIATDGPVAIPEHPLGRVLYVHPYCGLDEVLALTSRDVQTVSVEPWDRVLTVADDLVLAGVDRVVPLGRMARFRPGFVHDGFHPMRRMVRWVTIERGLEQKYRFKTDTQDEDEARVLYGRHELPASAAER